ncbi:hypothetical protein [Parabacteroides sp. PF5-9]|uniref:hypothetical protein n=1 Tax=Parabacteroides sp. PF5-9 TaxID=1742404 RepID=UPI0024743480|nr:hypothetical protein [Parabacteroides sp. PF5-9]MDH6359091.1 hypothetical protein [Parabacteroides sp. PF5-9]
MKRLLLVIGALIISMTVCVAQSNTDDVPFKVELSQLESFLKLKPYQKKKVKVINESFIQQQKAASGEQKMQQIIVENLSGMKDALTKDQFGKYMTLLTATNKNKKIMNESLFAEVLKQANK